MPDTQADRSAILMRNKAAQSVFLQAVADPTNGFDWQPAFAQFVPQSPNIDIDHIGLWIEVIPPDMFQHLGPGEIRQENYRYYILVSF